MEIVLLLIKQIVIMFIYMTVGYALFKKKLVSLQGCADLGRILLYVTMPASIIRSFLTEFTTAKLHVLAASFVIALLSLLLSILVSRLVFRTGWEMERFGATFSNAGFIGIPLVQLTLGEEAVFCIAAFVALLNILQWTYGVMIITGDRSAVSAKKVCSSPVVTSFLIGIALFFLPVDPPSIITAPLGAIAGMNGPMAMVVLGIYLAQVPLASIFTDRRSYGVTAVRLLVISALTILLLRLFPVGDHLLSLVILIAASAPVGTNIAIYAQLYHRDYAAAVRQVCLTTILCVLSIPAVIGIAEMIL